MTQPDAPFVPSAGPALPADTANSARTVGAMQSTVPQSIAGTGVLQVLTIASTVTDFGKDVADGGICDPANNRFVILEDGIYDVSFSYKWEQAPNPVAGTPSVRAMVNAAGSLPTIEGPFAGDAVIDANSLSGKIVLRAGQIVQLGAEHGTGADPVTDITPFLFSVVKVSDLVPN